MLLLDILFPGLYVFVILDYSIFPNSAEAFFQKCHQKEYQENFVNVLACLHMYQSMIDTGSA